MGSHCLVVGVDVGGAKKGFHAVALTDGRYADQIASTDAKEIATWCRELDAQFIGIDAPCAWSTDGRARPVERELMKEKIWCFSSPTRTAALAHPKDNFGWMLNGESLFLELKRTHALFNGRPVESTKRVCFETFPQAVACALASQIVSAKRKRSVRRGLLEQANIDIKDLTNIDKVDAALCALTANYFAQDQFKSYGNSETGFIVVPHRR